MGAEAAIITTDKRLHGMMAQTIGEAIGRLNVKSFV